MIGKTISHYKILEKLGEGGMGVVYKAQDSKLGREVALKTLPVEFAKDVDRITRLRREAKLLASLNHPNIAAIHGLEEEEDTRFLVLELVEGETLAERLFRGTLSVEEALDFCLQIAEALEAAHEKGIIHRDLKPGNVKITPDGKVKVLDFGLAKSFEAEESGKIPGVDLSKSPTLTVDSSGSGVILGTAPYMSPEQARGKPLDKRTDIWSFGCVLFELLTNKRAFEGETVTDIIATIIKGEPDWAALPEETPWRIRTLLRRCLKKDPHLRLRDIGDARIDIGEALASPEILEQDLTAPGWTRLRRRQMIPWILASLVLGAITAGIVVWRIMLPSPEAPASVSRFIITPPPTAPLTNRNGFDFVISPDGTRIAFLGEKGGKRMLYVHKLAELEAQVIPGTESASDPFFSPNGKWVGFESGQEGKLMKVLLSGGAPIAISDDTDASGAAWGSDNNIILAKGDGLWRLPAGGGKPAEKITQDNQVCSAPRILPGGRAVIFAMVAAGSTGNDEQVVVFFLETGELKILLQGTRPHYVPSGHLIFGREGALMAAPFDLERLDVTGDAVQLIEDVRWSPWAAEDFDLSENGTLVYVPGGDGAGIKRKLVWVDRQGKEEVLAAEPHQYRRIRLSPDGKRLAVAVRRPQNQDVYIYDLRREILSRLTFHPASDTFPLWTRDGLRVVFASNRDGALNLYWKVADGTGQVERLTTSPNLQLPRSLSPDGTKLVITERNPGTGFDIFVLSLKDEFTSSSLIQTPFVESRPSVSPDGRWIAYSSNESGQDEVYVRPFPNVDQGKWQISRDGGTEPLWLPDGSWLFYRDDQKMMKVSIQAEPTFTHGKPKALFELEGRYLTASAGQNYDISPDDQRFLMITEGEQTETAPGEIIVVLNWFEELKRIVPVGK